MGSHAHHSVTTPTCYNHAHLAVATPPLVEAPPPGPPPAPRSSRKGSRARAWLQQVPLLGCLKPWRYCCFFGAIFGIGSNRKIVPLFTTFPHFAPWTALSPFRGHTAFTRWLNKAASLEPLSRMFVYSGRHDTNNHDAAQQLQNSHAPRTDLLLNSATAAKTVRQLPPSATHFFAF